MFSLYLFFLTRSLLPFLNLILTFTRFAFSLSIYFTRSLSFFLILGNINHFYFSCSFTSLSCLLPFTRFARYRLLSNFRTLLSYFYFCNFFHSLYQHKFHSHVLFTSFSFTRLLLHSGSLVFFSFF